MLPNVGGKTDIEHGCGAGESNTVSLAYETSDFPFVLPAMEPSLGLEPKTSILPRSYTAIVLGRRRPAPDKPGRVMVKVKGLEPLLHRPKRRVLPLHYTLIGTLSRTRTRDT